jgi:hypothetical protein
VTPPPVPVPTLDELGADPGKVATIPGDVRQALVLRCLTVLAALTTVPVPDGDGRRPTAALEPDRLLTPVEAAGQLNVSPKWLYRHAARLPFTRRLSRKVLRFSEMGLRRWQATRRA